jgi:hypothetical protein
MLLLLAAEGASGMSRMGGAEVGLSMGLPCFSPAKEEFDRGAIQWWAIRVEKRSPPPLGEGAWGLHVTSRLPVPWVEGECLSYGQVAPGTAPSGAAPILKTGVVYSVFISGRTASPDDSTRGYRGKFCLLDGEGGERRLLHIKPGHRAWREEVCVAEQQP